MKNKRQGNLHPELKKELEARALRNFRLALDRVGPACPKWVRGDREQRRLLLRVYFKAVLKNHFRSAYGRPGEFYHVDHIVPLTCKVKGRHVACGLHVPGNLHPILAPINLAKGTMIVPEWLEKDSVQDLERHKEKQKARQEDRERRRRTKLRKRRATRQARVDGLTRPDEDTISRFEHAISKD